jgi:hypothetical protein
VLDKTEAHFVIYHLKPLPEHLALVPFGNAFLFWEIVGAI